VPKLDQQQFKPNTKFVLVALSLFIVLVGNHSGVGWSWDTTDYVASARSLAHGLGLLDVVGAPMTVRPPGYPMLIAVGEILNLNTSTTLLIINLMSAGLTTYFTYEILHRNASRMATILGTLFVVMSPSLLWQFTMAWSEPPFIALVLVCIFTALYLKNAWKYPILSMLYAGIFFIRFVGPVFAIPIAAVAILVDRSARGWVKAALYNGTALALSFIPVWWWLERNKHIDGTLTGARSAGGGTLIAAFLNGLGTIGTFFSAQPFDSVIYDTWSNYPFAAQVASVLLAFSIITLLIVLAMRLSTHKTQPQQHVLIALLMLSSVTGSYLLFSAYRFVHWEYGRLDTRMMTPILVPFVLMFVILIDMSLSSRRVIRWAVITAAIATLIPQVIITVRDAYTFGNKSRHMSTTDFTDSPLHVFARSLPDKTGLFSNAPQQLSAAVDAWPIFTQFQLDTARPVKCDHRYVVWYKNFPWQDNIPDVSPVLYDDAQGTIFDLGSCDIDINTVWP
jgi:hypothetical protein